MLQVMPLNTEDYDLIRAAEKVIEKNYWSSSYRFSCTNQHG